MSAATATFLGLRLQTTQAEGNMGDVNAAAAQVLNNAVAYFELDGVWTGQSVTFTTDAVDLGAGGTLSLDVVTANGASYGTLTPVVQTSKDNSTWVPAFVADQACSTYAKAILGTLEAIGADTTTSRRLTVDRYVRIVFTMAGGVTVDITVKGILRKN